MTATIDPAKKVLTIQIPLSTPERSKSGKTLVVASSHGIVSTSATIDGKPLQIGVNAFIKP